MPKWVCTSCGEEYEKKNPPCLQCAGEDFRQVEEEEVPDQIEATGAVEWVCEECGKRTTRNNTTCNNCGSLNYRQANEGNPPRAEPDASEFASSSSRGRRDLLYAGAIVGVIGVATFMFLTHDDYPTTTAPGEDEKAAGIRFETAETELREVINDERESEGVDTLSTARNVDAFAEYFNKKRVQANATDPDEVDNERFDGDFNVSDYHIVSNHLDISEGRAINSYNSASELARACSDSWFSEDQYRDPLTDPFYSKLGLDIHVDEDGEVFVLSIVS